MSKKVESPCTKECIFNYEDDYCTGCYRRLDDIWDWSKRPDSEKQLIVNEAERLKKELQDLERSTNCGQSKD